MNIRLVTKLFKFNDETLDKVECALSDYERLREANIKKNRDFLESLQIGVVVASASASKAISKEKSKTKIEGITESSMRLRAHSHDGRKSTANSGNSLLHNISSFSSSISSPTSSSGSEMQPSKGASSAVVGAGGGETKTEVVSVATSTFISKPPIARESQTRAHSHDGRLVTSAAR